MCLANAIVEHEMKVESNVVAPLTNVCDTDYPNIMKQKRNLTKLILDMDSLKARFLQASRHGSSTPTTKIKDELEEAEGKVEQARETLACDMLQLIAREAELSSVVLEYAKLQRNYHEAAFKILEEIIPEMELAIKSRLGPVFGRPLEEHLKVTGRKIAFPIELCVCGLLELGIAEEGIFRVTPGASKVRRMKVSLDANCMDLESALQFRDPHIFAGVLKTYLRELPEPLLTHKLYDQWIAAAKLLYAGNNKEGMQALWSTLHNLPQSNLDNLQYLIKFLSSLASNKHTNKMTPQNLAIVVAPSLIWSPAEDSMNIGINMNTASLHSIIVENLVCYCDWFFPGEFEFFVTMSHDVGLMNGHGTDLNNESSQPGDMKRTQSNSSLSDHNRYTSIFFWTNNRYYCTPPQGSPKPAVRVRKHKPAAPNPPGLQLKENNLSHEDKPSGGKEKREEEGGDGLRLKVSSGDFSPGEQAGGRPPEKQKESKEEKNARCKESLQRNCRDDEAAPSRTEVVETVEKPITVISDKVQKSPCDLPPAGGLDKRNSKSGEDLRKVKNYELFSSTIDRKKPPRPVPAPRTSLVVEGSASLIDDTTAKKPAIPERPANLQRPHSSSFRLPRNFDPATDTPQDVRDYCMTTTFGESLENPKSLKMVGG
ncbi:hypothetical protein AAG570_012411 [Ranatra chinensis]|uniref:Rho GTPase-activating protein 17 n=1 Tax=Ranatra chinensis TaxID=642074 RepID=A0ABD0YIR2_9HEMI